MANSDKNILITPNRGLSGQPEIALTGAGNSTMYIRVPDDTNASLNFSDSSNNSVFTIDDNFSSGNIFSVGDSLGNSALDIASDGKITLNKTTSINGSGLKLNESNSTKKLPKQKKGLLVYDCDEKNLKVSNGKTWISQTKATSLVRDGLVLHLDSALIDSYSRSGVIWNDLSGVMGNINVQNRHTDFSFQIEPQTNTYCLFNATNRASGNSPGIDIDLTRGFNKSEGTIELWVKPGDMTGAHGFFNNSDGSTYTNTDNWFWFGGWENNDVIYSRQGNPGFCCNDAALGGFRTSNYYVQDQWVNLATTWNIKDRRVFVYRNGYPLVGNLNLNSNIPMVNPTNTGQLLNGHTRGDNMQFKGYCSIYRIYNRELSIFEMERNFLSYRKRFGI